MARPRSAVDTERRLRKRAYDNARSAVIKREGIAAYGGRCVRCSYDDIRALQLDHIHDDGAEERSRIGCGGGVSIFKWLRKHGWPQGRHQVLCANCNATKQWEREKAGAA